MTATRTGSLTIADVRHRFADAFRPRASIYWSDLLATTAVCWAALAVSAVAPLASPVHLTSTLIAMLALFRAAIFVHEIAHQRRGALPGFELAWNVLVGVPFLAPSLTLGLRVVENDSGRAGVFRIRNLRVVGAFAALQHGDISAAKIRKLFGGATRARASHRPNAGVDVCAAG